MDYSPLVSPLQVTVSSLNAVLEYFIEATECRLSPFMSSFYDTRIGETNAAVNETFKSSTREDKSLTLLMLMHVLNRSGNHVNSHQ